MSDTDVKRIFSKNLKYYMDKKGLTNVELSNILGVSESTVGKWLLEKAIPRMGIIEKLSHYFNVPKSSLLEERKPTPTLDLSKYGITTLENRRTKKIPIVGEIACGVPVYADETYDDYIEVDEDIKVDFALRTKGDSMIGDNIVDGDIVLIKKVPMVEPHEIAVVVIEDEATLKRVKYDKAKDIVILEASNPNTPTMLYSGEELERINIIGKAVLLQRRL